MAEECLEAPLDAVSSAEFWQQAETLAAEAGHAGHGLYLEQRDIDLHVLYCRNCQAPIISVRVPSPRA